MQQKVAKCGARNGREVFRDLLGEYAVVAGLASRTFKDGGPGSQLRQVKRGLDAGGDNGVVIRALFVKESATDRQVWDKHRLRVEIPDDLLIRAVSDAVQRQPTCCPLPAQGAGGIHRTISTEARLIVNRAPDVRD